MKLLLFAALFLGGCATMNIDNFEDDSLTPNEMQTIATVGGEIMAGQYPPGKTTVALKPVGAFGEYLAEALRQRGFGVQESNAFALHYLLDQIDDRTWRLGLITTDWRNDSVFRRDGNNALIRGTQTQRIAP